MAMLQVTFLDVGQGDATLIRSPSGRTVLVDAGGRVGADRRGNGPGERIVVPYLRYCGISRLDGIVLTHPDDDHVEGFLAVVARFPVGWALDSDYPEGEGRCQQLRAHLARQGIPRLRARRGMRIDLGDGVVLEVLHPIAPFLRAERSPSNENAIVLRVVYGAVGILLMADAGAVAEGALLASRVRMRADLLRVGHHGAAGATGPPFLAAVRPRIAVVSCGRDNRFGHPAPATLNRLRGVGCTLFRTDRQGGILARTEGHRLWVTATLPG